MCEFFSAISDGKGRVEFFRVEDIAKEMARGNPECYDWNSHTSISHFIGLSPKDEDVWNKWEYDINTRVLKADTLVTTKDDVAVKREIRKYFKGKDTGYMVNLYNSNTGNYNTGNYNTGHYNTGNRNTGYYNTGHYSTGDCNTGNYNTGNYNTGNRNTGNYNTGNYSTGYYNTGDYNTGNYNTGHYNTGNRNTGHSNTGNYNTGHYNTGDYNTGNYNTGNYSTGNRNTGMFNTAEPMMRLFNQDLNITVSEFYGTVAMPDIYDIESVVFVPTPKMTSKEKKANPNHIATGGFLKVLDYKKAWKKFWKETTKTNRKKFVNLPNFDKKIFREITGIIVRKTDL